MILTVEAAWYGVTPVRARGRVDGQAKLACLLAVLVALLPVPTGSLANEPAPLLAEADRLAWLHDWVQGRPLFVQAGDARNALYCKVSRLRADVLSMSFIEVAGDLAKELENPLVQNDPELKLRLLVVKGNIDLEIDPPESRRDWEEVLSIAEKLGKHQWAARAEEGLQYLHRAMKVAAEHPEVSFPMLAHAGGATALVRLNREAEAALNQILERAGGTNRINYEAELLARLGILEAQANRTQSAIGHLEEAVALARCTRSTGS